MKNIKNLEDVRTALIDIENKLEPLVTKSLDLKGRQIKNLGASTDYSDAITRRELALVDKLLSDLTVRVNKIERNISDILKRLDAGGL